MRNIAWVLVILAVIVGPLILLGYQSRHHDICYSPATKIYGDCDAWYMKHQPLKIKIHDHKEKP